MIKSLRKKFIAIAMCSVFFVLAGIVGTINVINFANVNNTANSRLAYISENGGELQMVKLHGNENFDGTAPPNEEQPPELDKEQMTKDFKEKFKNLSAETPFDTRYFTATVDGSGTVVAVNTGNIAAVTEEEAQNYAEELAQKGKTGGFYGNGYKFTTLETDEGTMYIFLDCSREFSTFYSFLTASVMISLAGLALVFVLVVIFSKMAVKPVAESYEKQKQFITDAGHELKTPLTIIDANTEIIEMDYGESEWTESIKNQVKRLAELTQNLVFLSKMDEDSSKLNLADFSISDAVYDTAQSFEAVAKSNGKELEIEVEDNLSYCGDEYSIRRLVSLLLDNALKYSSDGSKIEIALSQSGKDRILTVKNSADSVEIGSLDKWFERFYRADASRNSKTGGSGIGLSTAKAIVEAHKGKIHAESKDGKTIVFTAIL